MKVNFDQMRKNLATNYNRLVTELNSCFGDIEPAITDLQNSIAGLLCLYDPDSEDCNDLSDIELMEYKD